MKTLLIIWNQKVDLILFVILITCFIIGIIQRDWTMLAGSLMISIGNNTFNFINKVRMIKRGENT